LPEYAQPVLEKLYEAQALFNHGIAMVGRMALRERPGVIVAIKRVRKFPKRLEDAQYYKAREVRL